MRIQGRLVAIPVAGVDATGLTCRRHNVCWLLTWPKTSNTRWMSYVSGVDPIALNRSDIALFLQYLLPPSSPPFTAVRCRNRVFHQRRLSTQAHPSTDQMSPWPQHKSWRVAELDKICSSCQLWYDICQFIERAARTETQLPFCQCSVSSGWRSVSVVYCVYRLTLYELTMTKSFIIKPLSDCSVGWDPVNCNDRVRIIRRLSNWL